MKLGKQLLLSFATVFVALLTIGCGSSGGSGDSAATSAVYGQSCGAGMITSQYGCRQACGTSSVIVNGQCLPINQGTGYGGISGYPSTGYGGGGNVPQVCQQQCPAGLVSVGAGWACLPQSNGCGTCYGYLGGYCYQGDGAQYYYGRGY